VHVTIKISEKGERGGKALFGLLFFFSFFAGVLGVLEPACGTENSFPLIYRRNIMIPTAWEPLRAVCFCQTWQKTRSFRGQGKCVQRSQKRWSPFILKFSESVWEKRSDRRGQRKTAEDPPLPGSAKGAEIPGCESRRGIGIPELEKRRNRRME